MGWRGLCFKVRSSSFVEWGFLGVCRGGGGPGNLGEAGTVIWNRADRGSLGDVEIREGKKQVCTICKIDSQWKFAV